MKKTCKIFFSTCRCIFICFILMWHTNEAIAIKNGQTISLAGKWTVSYNNQTAPIYLPGTLTDAHIGDSCTLKPCMQKEFFLNLKAKYNYIGVATYSKTVFIPKRWKKHNIILHFDRTLWTSQVKVNGKLVGPKQESLSTPHEYNITDYVVPGKNNQLQIIIDNTKQHDISVDELAHCYTNETQTKWNGILGNIQLEAKPLHYISRVSVYPQASNGNITVNINLNEASTAYNITKRGTIRFSITSPQGQAIKDTILQIQNEAIEFRTHVNMPQLWDEFSPLLYKAKVEYIERGMTDSQEISFGFRDLTNNHALLHINGHRLFLRGTLESCVFPQKGYPAMDENEWQEIFTKAKSYGINHLRFHSWCPPEAAFVAADKIGLYLQIELPLWAMEVGKDLPTLQFLYKEADNILSAYGDHPSFCFFSLGNELQGDFNAINELLSYVKKDSRRLYTATSFTFEGGHDAWPEPNDDYWISQWTKKGWLRGQGVFEERPVNFMHDYSDVIDSLPVPVVTHEIGQYSVYPDLASIDKFKGNLMPLNLMAIKEDLKAKGRIELAPKYLSASARFASILYKEEIERAMKTPGYSGFQLLGLSDYPGQGTALVGLLDVFWESKDTLATNLFRHACASVVPLAFYEKATYSNNEEFKATLKLANFSASSLKNTIVAWTLQQSDGTEIFHGKFEAKGIEIGNNQVLGNICVPLNTISNAEQLTLKATIANSNISNQWQIWVYPSLLPDNSQEVVVTQDIDRAHTELRQGKKVLLNIPLDNTRGLEGKFLPVFWSPIHFPNQPGTMGILCNPSHPVFKHFPTEEHSNWQWWDLCKHSKTMQLDSIEQQVTPLVTVMDNFYKNRNLALLFETSVGNGKLVVCSVDLANLGDSPVARQFKFSILEYMNSGSFCPTKSVDFNTLKSCIYNPQKVEIKKKSIYE